MEEPVFDVLRTREQLGYNVYATLRNTFGVLGFSITVDFQADKFRYEVSFLFESAHIWPCYHIVALQCKIPTVVLTTNDTVCYRS